MTPAEVRLLVVTAGAALAVALLATPLAGRLEHAIVRASPEAQIEEDLAELLAHCNAIRAGVPGDTSGAR